MFSVEVFLGLVVGFVLGSIVRLNYGAGATEALFAGLWFLIAACNATVNVEFGSFNVSTAGRQSSAVLRLSSRVFQPISVVACVVESVGLKPDRDEETVKTVLGSGMVL